MRYTKLFIITLILLNVNACDTCIGVNFDYILPIKIQNEFGENLLNPEHPNYINTDSVYLYRISKDGCEVLLNGMGADVPKSFRVLGNGDNTIMEIFLDGNGIALLHKHGNAEVTDFEDRNIKCTLLLKWNLQNTDTDTIFTTFINIVSTRKNPLPAGYCSFNLYDKVYINGELIVSSWEDNIEKMRQGVFPTIIK